VHIDLYRLDSEEEIFQIGWREMTEGTPIVAVEWADRAKEIWPEQRYIINMAVSGKDKRRIEIVDPK
jgi:tRNA threonylcarbamoyladenosine biosynthesis protein TsaE